MAGAFETISFGTSQVPPLFSYPIQAGLVKPGPLFTACAEAAPRRAISVKRTGLWPLPLRPTASTICGTAPYRTETNPLAVERGTCSGSFENGNNHCVVLQKRLAPGEKTRLLWMLGEGDLEEGRRAREKYCDVSAVNAAFQDLARYGVRPQFGGLLIDPCLPADWKCFELTRVWQGDLPAVLDAALARKGSPQVHLTEEMTYVNAYLYIVTQRYGKRLMVEADLPDELMNCLVPPAHSPAGD